jgi:KipI family sensor histidine kinase inhibitor
MHSKAKESIFVPAPEAPAASSTRIYSCGDDLVATDCPDTRSAQALADHLRGSGDWLECVAGIASCVAQFDLAAMTAEQAEQRLLAALYSVPAVRDRESELVEVPVCYGGDHGPDLEDVCRLLGMDRDAFIDVHAGNEYRVDMLGFTPGFAFIGGFEAARAVPRRPQPRVRLEPGSIGIVGGRTGIYTLPGPGGWQIVGRTPLRLFAADAEQPFRLRPGMRVRFVAISEAEFDAGRPA